MNRLAHRAASPLFIILGLALLIRLFVALRFWNIIAPDEVFQALEQAHRLVFGQGVVPWEYQVGLRCWLIPLLLAGPMALAHVFDPDPLAGLVLIRILLCVASLPVVGCAARWGERFEGRRGLWIAGLFAACWPDLWLMAPHPLEETLAADALVPAAFLATLPGGGMRRVAAAGFLLGLAFTLRLQVAPAVAIAGLALCGRAPARWRAALAAAAVPVLAAGVLDWVTWGEPFRSFWLNVWLNLVRHVASDSFGAQPASYFLSMLGIDWLWTLPVFLLLAWRGARLLPLPGVMALALLITHSLIAHKEFRFIFPAVALAAPLAGLGVAGLRPAAWLPRGARLPLAAALLAGPLCGPFTYFMLNWQTHAFGLFRTVAADRPALVSVQGWDKTFIPFDILFDRSTRLTSRTVTRQGGMIVQADAIIAGAETLGIPPGYGRARCVRNNWIPFTPPAAPLCFWRGRAAGSAAAAPQFDFPFPPAARPYLLKRDHG